ncbi:MAG: purine permease, partial [Thiomonas sp. 20-64-5]
ILSNVDYKTSRNNLMIVALGIGFGMLTLIAPNFFDHFPAALRPMLDSGILLTTLVTVILNAYFNGLGGEEAAREGLVESARVAEA